ncbi:SIMPL domain-containing protein [uncultured Aquimarina sp.]|uniref:SIMPL domain-containing protein n=1 Tax=uncultured Aquimarina sp. TaxID=575652 RepID=UPI00260D465C|nr:SIMPL domain-containing protein [uncultured Aquimarina sp.]
MKNKIYILLLLISSSINAQIRGNAATISKRNTITTEELVNPSIYLDETQKFDQKNLVPNPTITIDVRILNNIVADSYTAIFNITQIGKTSEETNNLMEDRVDKIKGELTANGILEENITIDLISFVPTYETVVEKKLFSTKYNEVPKGFELQQNIHIKFNKINQFQKILSTCAKNEIYNLVKVDYFINNIETVYSGLRSEILKTLKEKQQFYKDVGFDLSLYQPTIADTKYCHFPKEFYASYQAFHSISFESLNQTQGVQKTKKQTTYYYDPISYKNYDMVINPEILEPVVQIGMDIKLQYTPKPKEEKPIEKEITKPKYFIVSPNGNIDIKKLELN